MSIRKLWTGLALLCAAVVLTSTARAADAVPSFKTPPDLTNTDQTKKFVSDVAVAVLKAAHTTGKNVEVDSYKFDENTPKAGRTQLTIKIKWKGATGVKEYTSDVKIDIDSSDRTKWEVLKITYSDNDPIPFSRSKVDGLVQKFSQ